MELVSAAVGNAVLDVIEEEDLQKHALTLGNYLEGNVVSCPALGQFVERVSFSVWSLLLTMCKEYFCAY